MKISCKSAVRGSKDRRLTNRILFHNEQAKALARLGRQDEALKAADQAVGLAADIDKLAVRTMRVRVLLLADQFEQGGGRVPGHAQGRTASPGRCWKSATCCRTSIPPGGRWPRPRNSCELILKADPDDATANNDLGYIWADRNKNLDEAEAMIRKALELDRRQRKQRRGAGAGRRPGQRRLRRQPGLGAVPPGQARRGPPASWRRPSPCPTGDDPVVWDHLGDVYFRLEKPDQARAAWQKALQLYEQEKRRKMDERYEEMQHKLKCWKHSSNTGESPMSLAEPGYRLAKPRAAPTARRSSHVRAFPLGDDQAQEGRHRRQARQAVEQAEPGHHHRRQQRRRRPDHEPQAPLRHRQGPRSVACPRTTSSGPSSAAPASSKA